MWPWEHVVVGYLTYSLLVHVSLARSPTGAEAITVAFASVLPDLIDKPLAWELGLFSSGYAIGHSVFFAVPLSVAVLVVSSHFERTPLGLAFTTGYLLHLPGDVVPHYVRGRGLPLGNVLWPIRSGETSYPEGFTGTLVSYVGDYGEEILSSEPSGYTVAVFGLMVLCVLLWIYDGAPGLREPITFLRR